MRQCELEKVIFTKGAKVANRTGDKMVSFVDGVTPDMVGAIIDLKKVSGLWVVDKVHEQEVERYQIKHSWHVVGL